MLLPTDSEKNSRFIIGNYKLVNDYILRDDYILRESTFSRRPIPENTESAMGPLNPKSYLLIFFSDNLVRLVDYFRSRTFVHTCVCTEDKE